MTTPGTDILARLLAVVTPEESVELKTAHNGRVKALKAYQNKPGKSTRDDLTAAKEYLEQVTTDLSDKYFPAPEATDPAADFAPTAKAAPVYRWLTANGWQISQRQFYDHVKEGKLGRDLDGKFTPRRAQKYARTFLRRTETGKTLAEDDSALAREKLQAEIRLKTTQEQREAHRLAVEQGKYLPREEVETMLAGRAAILEADFQHLAYARAPELVALVAGNPAHTDQLIQALLAARDEWLNRYATTREFVVEFQPPQPTEEGADNGKE